VREGIGSLQSDKALDKTERTMSQDGRKKDAGDGANATTPRPPEVPGGQGRRVRRRTGGKTREKPERALHDAPEGPGARAERTAGTVRKGDSSSPLPAATGEPQVPHVEPNGPGPVVELVDVGRELLAYLPRRGAGHLGGTEGRQGAPAGLVPGGGGERGTREARDSPGYCVDGTGSREASVQEPVCVSLNLAAFTDRLAEELSRSAAGVFASLDGRSGGRERIEWASRDEKGARYLFASVPGGLLAVDRPSGLNGHRRKELRFPCLPASLAVVKESLIREVEAAGLARDQAALFETAVEEAVRNAVEHSSDGESFGLAFEQTRGEVVVAISVPARVDPFRILGTEAGRQSGDGNGELPRDGGRGLPIMKGLLQDVLVAGGATGLVTAMRWRGPSAGEVRAGGEPASVRGGPPEPARDRAKPPRAESQAGEEQTEGIARVADVRRLGDRAVLLVVATDKLDGEVASLLAACLTPLVADQSVHHLIVDLGRVGVLASSCLGILIKARNSVASLGRRMSLVGVREEVRRVLEVAGLLGYFDVRGSLSDVVSTRVRLVKEEGGGPSEGRGTVGCGLPQKAAGMRRGVVGWLAGVLRETAARLAPGVVSR